MTLWLYISSLNVSEFLSFNKVTLSPENCKFTNSISASLNSQKKQYRKQEIQLTLTNQLSIRVENFTAQHQL
jgi:hypothetical protein